LKDADVIISATSGPHYTFLADVSAESLCDCDRRHLFIDLAVPRDIDPDIADIANCEIKDIDYIKELAKDNNSKKLTEAEKIKILIEQKVEEQRKNLLFRYYVADVSPIRERLQDKAFSSLLYKLRDNLDYDTFSKVLDTIKEEKECHIFPL
jgi:glutamyl-tRNA reductase